MKTLAAITLFLLGLSLSMACAQTGVETLLPATRQHISVEDLERNPFAKVEEPKPAAPDIAIDTKSEESRIEAVLEGLSVVGRTKGENGWKVLLGDLILEQGKFLPPIIEGQTQTLRVASIYDSMIEIEWVNKDSREIPKRMFIVIQLKPLVGSALSGRRAAVGATAPPVVLTRPQNETSPPSDAQLPER